jgi:nucleoside-diphosphate-sugar epimerase
MPSINQVVLTGSEGFIGQSIISRLKTFKVFHTMDKAGKPNINVDLEKSAPGVHDTYTDVDQAKSAVRAAASSCAVIHLASKSVVVVPPGEEQAIVDHNMACARNMLEYCNEYRIPMLVNASSSAVYGDIAEGGLSEELECKPLGAYGMAKLKVEEMFDRDAAKMGVKVVSYRLFNAIGWFQKESMLPWLIMDALRTGEPITLFGHTRRSWTAVQDIADAFGATVDAQDRFPVGHTVLNFGLDKPMSQVELMSMFELATNIKATVPYIWGDRRPFEMESTQPDMTKFRAMMGTSHLPLEFNLNRAVQNVIDYYQYKQTLSGV